MKVATFTALAILVSPVMGLLEANPLIAQVLSTNTLQALSTVDKTLYLNGDDVFEQSLRVETATTFNGVSISAGSVLRGRFEPVAGGLRYVTEGVQIGSRFYTLRAQSEVLHDVKDPRETSSGAVLGDAAIGAAGGTLLSEVFGDVNWGGVIGGAATGVILGNVTAQRVVMVEPNQAIILELQSIALN